MELGEPEGIGVEDRHQGCIGNVDPHLDDTRRHEGVDLNGGPEAHRTESSFNARAMRQSRPATRGLLIIYPLDPEPLHAQARTVIGLALSFPKTSDEGKAFVANRGVTNG